MLTRSRSHLTAPLRSHQPSDVDASGSLPDSCSAGGVAPVAFVRGGARPARNANILQLPFSRSFSRNCHPERGLFSAPLMHSLRSRNASRKHANALILNASIRL